MLPPRTPRYENIGVFSFMQYHVYILYSNTRKRYYIGYTSDLLEERLRRHNSNHKGFTGGLGEWGIVYKEAFTDKPSAMKREKEIKGWKSRRRIEELIMKGNGY